MRASLCYSAGVLWVARFARGWRVEPYDLDGRALAGAFRVPAKDRRARARIPARARISALAVDRDHRLWLADSGAIALRCFSAFGQELAPIACGAEDVRGALGPPAAVACEGVEDEARLLVAAGGVRRAALHLVRPDGSLIAALRSRGEPDLAFQGLVRCGFSNGGDARGRAWACERGTGLVQVFRGERFDYAFRAPEGEPLAAAGLEDGRWVVLCSRGEGGSGEAERSAVHLCDRAGKSLRVLARSGPGEGELAEPEDLAIEEAGASEARTRLALLDRGGERIQIYNLQGACHGAFRPGRPPELPSGPPSRRASRPK